MKRKATTTVGIILIVLAVVLLGIIAFLYFVDAPVVEEGQVPTVAQKIILLGKKYLGELLGAFGVSGITVMAFLTKWIYDSSKKTLKESSLTSAEVAALKEENVELKEKLFEVTQLIMKLTKKQDIANNMLLTTFSLSELPVSVREQIHNALSEYNGVDKATETVRGTVEEVENTRENEEQPATAEVVSDNEQGEDKNVVPVYM